MSGAAFLDQRAQQMLVRQPDDWRKYLDPEETVKVKSAGCFRNDLKEALLNPDAAEGYEMPWQKCDAFKFRPSELTIWTGYNGHRKSMVMGNVGLGFQAQGAKLFVMSLEMKPVKSLKRLVRQFVGVAEPTIPYVDKFFDWSADNLWFYDYVGTAKPDLIVAMARYAATEIGCDHIFIDSLMKCGISPEDYPRQASFVSQLHAVAADTGAHVHLVAHSKKPATGKETELSTKYGVAGHSDITNIADNVLVVFKKESGDYDMLLDVAKQREGESEPKFAFHFDEASLQHKPFERASAMSCEDWERCLWR